MSELKQFAEQCEKAGIWCVATNENKAATYKWKETSYHTQINNAFGVGVMCGNQSGGIECLDFDNKFGDVLEVLNEFLEHKICEGLFRNKKIVIESTTSGGYHLIFKSSHFEGNQKLASETRDGRTECIIETRGDNGYFVCSPTKGYEWINFADEDTGESYDHNIWDLVELNEYERNELISLAKSFNKVVDTEHTTNIVRATNDIKVGDLYNDDLEGIREAKQILTSHGWQIKGKHCIRPTKKEGTSATFGYVAANVFYVFSSNALPFEQEKAYKPFQIKAILEHNGDFKACAKELYQRYGIESKQPDAPQPIETPKEELKDLLKGYKIDPKQRVERPPTILSVCQQIGTSMVNIPVLSQGDLSLLQGKQKSKKTYLTSTIATSLLNNDVHSKLYSHLNNGQKFAFFDTEQSVYYATKTSYRIFQSSGTSNFDYFALRDASPKQRKELIEHYLVSNSQCAFIFIDGIVDLLLDFNDLKECSELIQWLLMITKKYNVHCLNILHENASDGKARGHIGTMLSQKAETVLQITKNEQDESRSTIKAKDVRGKGFTPFDIEIDNDGIPNLVEMLESKKIY